MTEQRTIVKSTWRCLLAAVLVATAMIAGANAQTAPTPELYLVAIGDVPVDMTNQQRPDFSGERDLNRQASTLSPAMSGVQSGIQRIDHKEPSIRVHLTFVVDGKPFETEIERLTDGREITETRQGRRSVSSARWDGDALVFAMRSSAPNCEGTISIRYELGDGGRTVRATENIRGCGRDQDNVWIFERR